MPSVSRPLTIVLPALFCLLLSCMVALSNVHPTSAQSATPRNCNVLLMIDKSLSMRDNWLTLRTQVENLFDALGTVDGGNISLGYWTFSAELDPAVTTYNEPYRSFTNTAGGTNNVTAAADFIRPLPEDPDLILRGKTNYEQAFGYNNGVANNKTDLKALRQDANVLVLLTDGLPNYPTDPNNGDPTDGNNFAREAGYNAREKYGAGTPVIGSYVKQANSATPNLASLNYTINHDETNSTDIGPLDFGNIERYLTTKIADKCNVDIPNYSLNPSASLTPGSDSVVLSGGTVSFNYHVKNDTVNSTGVSDWQPYNFVLKPNVANILTSSTDGVPDCAAIEQKFGAAGNAKCVTNNISSDANCTGILDQRNSASFSPTYDQSLYTTPSGCIQVPDDLPIGSQICSVIRLGSPGGGRSNRISNAACVPIGKAPLVQVHGGDVRVGRNFFDDATTNTDSGVYTSKFKVSSEPKSDLPNGRTFGSWVEYGILAPGPIMRTASLSGYADPNKGYGYDDPIAMNSCDLALNRLTFANVVAHSSECGHLSETPTHIPDLVSQLSTNNLVNSSPVSPLKLDASPAGLYSSANTNFEIEASTITKGKTIVVYVPNGTVTISGDINNEDAVYGINGKISEIPQLVIIAKNISIKETVNRVDAWLIANGGEGDGKIDTCVGFAPKPFSSQACGSLLTINGPIMARELELFRTKVDLSDTTCKVTASQTCKYVGDPAEIINLPGSSILWAKSYGANPDSVQTSNTVELPPYF
ncbi:MAG: exported protein of unknown function [Candidatus Saccharibacteria bacterium]|nr:exported protein of unknown function [Candidatus Saccharibacteria bacterium]